jgi:hypothetical protein
MTETDTTIAALADGEDRPCPPALESAIRQVADRMHRLNNAIVQAVEAGATIELVRCSRYHDGKGRWGDQMQPVVTIREDKPAATMRKSEARRA